MGRMRHVVVLLAIAVLLGACASMGGGDSEPFATLVVHNDGTSIVTVYALRAGGSRMRLGQVSPLSQAELPIRHHVLGGTSELQVLIDPLGSRQTYASNPIHVSEGDVLEMRVSSLIR